MHMCDLHMAIIFICNLKFWAFVLEYKVHEHCSLHYRVDLLKVYLYKIVKLLPANIVRGDQLTRCKEACVIIERSWIFHFRGLT
ncbi:hypothetical protein SKAU_G00176440 [Synaphobranchus kaupii]|uniref:Secreted protein n=1 Tax=Synaphobranchus kaupii TaxID=118154 RepID=A0A9Q1FM13_SYNKA|nr:hypothetical protein SKAU_G00176440 [Synaphobranchus kaupii]